MNITIITVGKIKEKFYREAIGEYSKRLQRYCKLVIEEVADEKTPDEASQGEIMEIKRKEGERILKKIPKGAYVFTLEIQGKEEGSVEFANKMMDLSNKGKSHFVFIIGGSLGLHSNVSAMANEKISFSKMTFPHQLMRVILLEQVYRAFRILNHEPYHK